MPEVKVKRTQVSIEGSFFDKVAQPRDEHAGGERVWVIRAVARANVSVGIGAGDSFGRRGFLRSGIAATSAHRLHEVGSRLDQKVAPMPTAPVISGSSLTSSRSSCAYPRPGTKPGGMRLTFVQAGGLTIVAFRIALGAPSRKQATALRQAGEQGSRREEG
jgi:hypothetical protein